MVRFPVRLRGRYGRTHSEPVMAGWEVRLGSDDPGLADALFIRKPSREKPCLVRLSRPR
jgi:uncharacterized protein YcsI (UPF0317 family)